MKIISHRGYWLESEEKNSLIAFERSLNLFFGIETDIRDSQGQIVISHDIPLGNEMLLTDFLGLVSKTNLPLALNIKADGLARKVKKIVDTVSLVDWFVFDMSIPDMREYLQLGLPVFTRISDIETEPVFFEKASGIWLDGFESVWYDINLIRSFLDNGKRVCIVSPELHCHPHESCWSMIRSSFLVDHQDVYICTDFPQKAKEFFNE